VKFRNELGLALWLAIGAKPVTRLVSSAKAESGIVSSLKSCDIGLGVTSKVMSGIISPITLVNYIGGYSDLYSIGS
jgi:hypothetical protein